MSCIENSSLNKVASFGIQEERFVLLLKGFQYEILHEFKLLKETLMQNKEFYNHSCCSCKCRVKSKSTISSGGSVPLVNKEMRKPTGRFSSEILSNAIKPCKDHFLKPCLVENDKICDQESIKKHNKELSYKENISLDVNDVRAADISNESLKTQVATETCHTVADHSETENDNHQHNKNTFSSVVCEITKNKTDYAVKIESDDIPLPAFTSSRKPAECDGTSNVPAMDWLLGQSSEILSHFDQGKNLNYVEDNDYPCSANIFSAFVADYEVEKQTVNPRMLKSRRLKPKKLADEHTTKSNSSCMSEEKLQNMIDKEFQLQSCKKAARPKRLLKPKDKACRFCDKNFSSSFQLMMHEKNHQLDKVITCTVCGYLFSKEANLKDHMIRKHSAIKPCVICPICKQTLSNKFCLKRHIKMKHNSVITII